MSVSYRMIDWNRQKKVYDLVLGAILVGGIGTFAGVTALTHPGVTAETLIIRSTAIAALVMLHVILMIGPLCRLDERFLPLLYNRRHLGVTMFFLALIHGAFSIIQFHGFGDTNPLVSVLTAYWKDYNPANGIQNIPFEIFGVVSLVILFLMAATSHDFWLKNLGASFWKSMHMLVYIAYGSVIIHVVLGALQSEQSSLYPIVMGIGFAMVVGLHLVSFGKERAVDSRQRSPEADGYILACMIEDVQESIGHVVSIGTERVAVWNHAGRYFGTSKVCPHQGGPVGEGRIVDGCATCPWHGWNYKVEDGVSPPPFHEILPTYPVRIYKGSVYVHPEQNPPSTKCPGATP